MPQSRPEQPFAHTQPTPNLGVAFELDFIEKNGGAKGSRTPDLLNAIAQRADQRL